MTEFMFEPVSTPWEMALSQLGKSKTFSAARFLRLMDDSDDQGAEDAALELEQRGVLLDVSDLPLTASGSQTAARVSLEGKLYRSGRLLCDLEENDPLRLTLEEIEQNQHQVDTPALLAKCAEGEIRAMQDLTAAWLPFVVKCAGEYLDRGVMLMDLIQEGSLGLWQAILNYESGDFSEVAGWWIRQSMARAATLQARANGVGQQIAALVERYRSADRVLLNRLGKNASDEEIALEIGIRPEEVASLRKMMRQIQDLDRINRPEEPQQQEEDEQAVEDTAYFQSRQRIDEMLSGLSEQEAKIVSMRFGLDGKMPMTAIEVGEKLGLTAQEISRIEAEALLKMRNTNG